MNKLGSLGCFQLGAPVVITSASAIIMLKTGFQYMEVQVKVQIVKLKYAYCHLRADASHAQFQANTSQHNFD